jgi:hypothetical protein
MGAQSSYPASDRGSLAFTGKDARYGEFGGGGGNANPGFSTFLGEDDCMSHSEYENRDDLGHLRLTLYLE